MNAKQSRIRTWRRASHPAGKSLNEISNFSSCWSYSRLLHVELTCLNIFCPLIRSDKCNDKCKICSFQLCYSCIGTLFLQHLVTYLFHFKAKKYNLIQLKKQTGRNILYRNNDSDTNITFKTNYNIIEFSGCLQTYTYIPLYKRNTFKELIAFSILYI